MHRRQLPIGIQDFRTIREQDMSNVHPQPPGARTPADHDDDATRRCCWPGTNEPLPVTFTTQWSARTPQEWEDDNPQADAPPWEPRPYTMIAMPATTRALYVTGYIVLAMRHPSIGLGFDWRTDLQGPPGRVAHRCDDPVFATGAAMTARAFGDAEIVDLRPALASAHHPDAQRDTPVWGATHVRAARL